MDGKAWIILDLWLFTTVYQEHNSNTNTNLKTRFQLQNWKLWTTVIGVWMPHSPKSLGRLFSSWMSHSFFHLWAIAVSFSIYHDKSAIMIRGSGWFLMGFMRTVDFVVEGYVYVYTAASSVFIWILHEM
jgi:hypothetical protein